MFARIHYGNAASDNVHARTTYKTYQPAAARYDHPVAAANVCRLAAPQPSFAAAGGRATPVRSTTPVRASAAHTPVRSTRADNGSCSSFMTQAARGDATPRNQMSRPSAMHAHTAPLRRGPALLPSTPLDQRMLLVLDMDETLLHADVSPVPHDVSFVVRMDNGQSTPVYVKFRPHLNRFLAVVSRLFEVVVFTASIPRYANQVLDFIDPHGQLVHHRLFREHCTEVNGTYVKDLDLLGRPMARISIVDNSPIAYSFHPDNAVAIPSWYECDRDTALQQLLPHLERMARAEHVYDDLEGIRRVLRWE
jgi:RNA polymerase II subunit A small phosphatase-like protein